MISAYDIVKKSSINQAKIRILCILLFEIIGNNIKMNFMFIRNYRFQADDANLAPQVGEGAFEFDQTTSIPSEGFKF